MMEMTDLLNAENAVLVAATLTLISVVTSVAKEAFASRIGKRILPLLPIVVAMGLAYLGVGEAGEAAGLQGKLMLGLLAGIAAGQTYKVGKTTAMGYGLPAKNGSSASAEGESS